MPGGGRRRGRDARDRPHAELRSASADRTPVARHADREPARLSLGFRGARDDRRHAPDRARVHRTAQGECADAARRAGAAGRTCGPRRATIRPMATRRDQRHAHVRPRPPSTGRPAPVKVKPRAPGPTRLSTHRPIQRSGGMPLVVPPRAAGRRRRPRRRRAVRRRRRDGRRRRRRRLDGGRVHQRRDLDAEPAPVDPRADRPARPRAAERAVHQRADGRPRRDASRRSSPATRTTGSGSTSPSPTRARRPSRRRRSADAAHDDHPGRAERRGSTTSRPRSSVRAANPMRRSPFATCTTTRRRRSPSARPRTTPP